MPTLPAGMNIAVVDEGSHAGLGHLVVLLEATVADPERDAAPDDRRVYAWRVETKQEIREFLTSRRARIALEQAGFDSYGSRRVPGLCRQEVAVLAGVSVPQYPQALKLLGSGAAAVDPAESSRASGQR